MKLLVRVLLISVGFALALLSSSPVQAVEVVIGVSDNLAPSVVRAWEKYPDACAKDDLFSPEWLRTTLEFFFVCRALRIGGLDAEYSFKNYPNSARARAEIKKGSVAIMIDFPWREFSADESLYQSIAVLPEGSFAKGIYTRPGHSELLKVETIEELRRFTAVSSRTWTHDWAALQRMGVKTVNVARYVQMGEMVKHARADYFVGEIPGADDLSQYIAGERFVPVSGLKILLPGSRHVAVSKKVDNAKRIFDALQAGLKDLTDRGLVRQGYRVSGFFNPAVENWKTLCCN